MNYKNEVKVGARINLLDLFNNRSKDNNFGQIRKNMKKILAIVSVGVFPVMALAQTYTGGGVGGLFDMATTLLNRAVPIIISLAVVYFIYQVFRYAVAGNEDDKALAKTHMIWGIVGIFVMVSIWGLVAILTTTFGTASTTPPGVKNLLPL